MVTVTLVKTAVAKNLSQSIIRPICVEHQNLSKSIRQPCQYPILGYARAFPGFHYATPLPFKTKIRHKTQNVNAKHYEISM